MGMSGFRFQMEDNQVSSGVLEYTVDIRYTGGRILVDILEYTGGYTGGYTGVYWWIYWSILVDILEYTGDRILEYTGDRILEYTGVYSRH